LIRVKIISQGEDLGTFVSRVKNDNDEMIKNLENLGREIHSFMQQTIVQNIKRLGSTGNLVRSIQFGLLGSGGWWIGDIDYLNQFAKMWRWLNYGIAGTGRTIPPSTAENPRIRGQFIPGEPRPMPSSFGQGRFQKGFYPIYPKKAISPINFIEKSIFLLENKLPSVIGGSVKMRFYKEGVLG